MSTTDNSPQDVVLAGLREKVDADLPALLVEAFVPKTDKETVARTSVKVPALTDQNRTDLKVLPEIFGQVQVSEPRALTDTEAKALVEERDVIDRLMLVLKKRKDETLRSNLANHLDALAEEAGLVTEDTPRDKDGHYIVKQDVPVEGTGRKIQRIVSEGKASVDSAMLERLHEEGVLSREEYLSLTSPPTVKRNFDPDKARKAVLKDPALLEKIAAAVKAPRKTNTIKVANDS